MEKLQKFRRISILSSWFSYVIARIKPPNHLIINDHTPFSPLSETLAACLCAFAPSTFPATTVQCIKGPEEEIVLLSMSKYPLLSCSNLLCCPYSLPTLDLQLVSEFILLEFEVLLLPADNYSNLAHIVKL
jgi:hypothetical protein